MANESVQARPVNPFEEARRKHKVTSLVSVIDARARSAKPKLDPCSSEFVEELPRMDVFWWRQAAKVAMVPPPSETTIAAVLAFYRARLDQVRAARAGC